MIRVNTIKTAIAKIIALRETAMWLERSSIAKYNFVTPKTAKAISAINAEADAARCEIIARLIGCGLCSDESGLTSSDADNPVFAGIDCLWEIGNGDWC